MSEQEIRVADMFGMPVRLSWFVPLTRRNRETGECEDVGGYSMQVPYAWQIFGFDPAYSRTEIVMHPIRAAQAFCPDLSIGWGVFLGMEQG